MTARKAGIVTGRKTKVHKIDDTDNTIAKPLNFTHYFRKDMQAMCLKGRILWRNKIGIFFTDKSYASRDMEEAFRLFPSAGVV